MSDSRRRWGKLRRLPSGRWQASFVVSGNRYFALDTFEDQDAGAGWLAHVRDDIELAARRREPWEMPNDVRLSGAPHRDLPTPTSSPAAPAASGELTLRRFASQWVSENSDLRPGTRERYSRLIRRQILNIVVRHPKTEQRRSWDETRPGLGDVPVSELTASVVESWWADLPKDHRRSADAAYQLLKSMLATAVKRGLLSSNPCDVRGAGKPSAVRHAELLEPTDVIAIADAIRPPRLRALVLIGGFCGLRSGELRALRAKDLDLDSQRPVIRVRRGVTRVGSKLVEGPPKTAAGIRDVPVPAALIVDLHLHVEVYCDVVTSSAVTSSDRNPLLFPGNNGGCMTESELRRAWVRATEQTGHEGAWVHDLRKSAMTLSALSGASVRELQTLAGHVDAATSMRYQQLAQGHLLEVTDRTSQAIARAMGETVAEQIGGASDDTLRQILKLLQG